VYFEQMKTSRRTPAGASGDDFWILDRAQILCLASSRRQEMVDRLAATGPMSVRELAAALGVRPSALYHHMEKLTATGLAREAGTRTVNRRAETLYATPSARMRLRRALAVPRFHSLIVRTVAGMCRQMERDFAAGIAQPDAEVEGPRRNLGFFRLLGSPGPEALAEINRSLDRIAELLWTDRAAAEPTLVLGWTLAPVRRRRTTQRPARKGS
jgi:DNA-binding transcriptional ArsR family regulator